MFSVSVIQQRTIDSRIVMTGENVNNSLTYPSPNENILQYQQGYYHNLFLYENGQVDQVGDNTYNQTTIFPYWDGEIKQMTAGGFHSVYIVGDRNKVEQVGRNDYGQVDIPQNWEFVRKIQQGRYHTVQLFYDGHVEMVGGQGGNFPILQQLPQNWTQPNSGITNVRCGISSIVQTFQDGHQEQIGYYGQDGGLTQINNFPQEWNNQNDIVVQDQGLDYVVQLFEDGHVEQVNNVGTGHFSYNIQNDWSQNVIDLNTGFRYFSQLFQDGHLEQRGDLWNGSGWNPISNYQSETDIFPGETISNLSESGEPVEFEQKFIKSYIFSGYKNSYYLSI